MPASSRSVLRRRKVSRCSTARRCRQRLRSRPYSEARTCWRPRSSRERCLRTPPGAAIRRSTGVSRAYAATAGRSRWPGCCASSCGAAKFANLTLRATMCRTLTRCAASPRSSVPASTCYGTYAKYSRPRPTRSPTTRSFSRIRRRCFPAAISMRNRSRWRPITWHSQSRRSAHYPNAASLCSWTRT